MKLLYCYLLLLFCTITGTRLVAQTDSGRPPVAIAKDTVLSQPRQALQPDSARPVAADTLQKDSLTAVAPLVSVPRMDTGTYGHYIQHPYLPLNKRAIYMISSFRERRNLDDLFYLLIGVLMLLTFIRMVFGRYFRNLFVLFLQTSLRQKQTRDQLLQDNMGSLFTNFLFVVSASIYAALLIQSQQWLENPFWHLVLYGAGLLTLVYAGKFLFLRFAGWVFNSAEAAGNYTFVVFLVNKVIGVALVPALFLLAFAQPAVKQVAVTVSLGAIGLLFAYRYVVSFAAIRNTLRVNALHFLLYLCAVEILPLLLLYKLMSDFIGGRF